jgi:hypothetical protein
MTLGDPHGVVGYQISIYVLLIEVLMIKDE